MTGASHPRHTIQQRSGCAGPCQACLMNVACVTQIMVDDAAAIVIMLGPEPKQAAQKLTAPPAAGVASVSNTVANSPEAKAARDKLAAIPYQNFFKHLQLVHTQSTHPPLPYPCMIPCMQILEVQQDVVLQFGSPRCL